MHVLAKQKIIWSTTRCRKAGAQLPDRRCFLSTGSIRIWLSWLSSLWFYR